MTSNAHATAQRIVLASRPTGKPVESNFRLEAVAIPKPGPQQLLLRTLYLSLDPYMRGRMDDAKSYAASVEIDGVMTGECVAEVVESHHPDFAAGDIVLAHAGWQTHALSDGHGVRKIEELKVSDLSIAEDVELLKRQLQG